LPRPFPRTTKKYPAETNIPDEERNQVNDEQKRQLEEQFKAIAGIMDCKVVDRKGKSIAEYDAFTHTVELDSGLAARAPPAELLKALLQNIISYFSLIAQGYTEEEAQVKIVEELRKNQEKLAQLIGALDSRTTPFGINVEEAFLNKLKDFIAEYPARLDNVNRSIYASVQWLILKRALNLASREYKIKYTLKDRSEKSIAAYYPQTNTLEIDSRLASIMPIAPFSSASRAFQILINDIFEHAKLYKEGKDKWQVWDKRASYYRNHVEEYLQLMDLLKGGSYAITGLETSIEVDNDYFIKLRMNVPLRVFLRENHQLPIVRKYSERFNKTSHEHNPAWPEDYQLPLDVNWILTEEEVDRIVAYFTRSEDSLRLFAESLRALRQEGSFQGKFKITVAIGMQKEKNRITPYDKDTNPAGEDSIRAKIYQLNELIKGYEDILEWELFLSVHRSPDNSGQVAEEVLKSPDLVQYYRSGQARVLYITQEGPSLGKGGKVDYIMKKAIEETPDRTPSDVVIYTDADITVDLRLIGLLVGAMLNRERIKQEINSLAPDMDTEAFEIAQTLADLKKLIAQLPDASLKEALSRKLKDVLDLENIATYGSRIPGMGGFSLPGLDPSPYEEEGIANNAGRNFGPRFFYPEVNRKGLRETQCGFKLYPKKAIEAIIEKAKDTTFSFDTELFTLSLRAGFDIREIGIFWSDSSAEESGTNPAARWDMGRFWVEQGENLNKEKPTMEDEDLQLLKQAFQQARTADTLESAKQIAEWLVSTGADKYFSYPARLKPELRLPNSQSERKALTERLRQYLNRIPEEIRVSYTLKDLTLRPLAVSVLAIDVYGKYRVNITRTIQIDERLALIAPTYDENSSKSQAFQVFINDIFRFAASYSKNNVKVYAIEDNIKELLKKLSESQRLLKILKDARIEVEESYWDALEREFPFISQIKPILGGGLEQKDTARPLPGEPMPSREEVNQEVRKHNLDKLEVIGIDSTEVKQAIEYLKSIGEYQIDGAIS
jgi:predicted DNA-binding protein YlxM (UPF0122 family)